MTELFIEIIICSNPLIEGAIMFGRSRNQGISDFLLHVWFLLILMIVVGVLIEPSYPINLKSDAEIEKFRNAIWSSVEKANKFAPSHSRIFKEYILICDPVEKPFLRTAKGSISRSATIRTYEAEIDAIYRNVEDAISSRPLAH